MKIMCPNCGKKIDGKGAFCNFCSAPIENVEKKKYNPKFLICGLLICVVVAAILIYVNSESKKSLNSNNSSQNKEVYNDVTFDSSTVIKDDNAEYKISITDAKITLETDSMIFIEVSGRSTIVSNNSYYTRENHFVDFIVYDDNKKIDTESEYIPCDDGFTCQLIIDRPSDYKGNISLSIGA